MNHFENVDPKQLFGDYMKITGVPFIGPVTTGEEGLIGAQCSSWSLYRCGHTRVSDNKRLIVAQHSKMSLYMF